MTKLPTWVRFPNLPLQCWTPLCLSKLASVIGKLIRYDDSTTNMTRLSYTRVLIKVDLLGDLPSSVNVVLPNGSNLAHSSSPSADTMAVKKQQPYSQRPHVDPITTEVATSKTRSHSSPRRKKTKCADPKPVSDSGKEEEALPVKRQYLTRSKASKIEAQPSSGKPGKSKDLVLLHSSSDDTAPSLMM
ncbi:hypothetical protein NC653_031197 [Populus alba x Populus x berolinensis]|uniref:DUF4283 domain-containing protein n=2 Tax=Populus alba x Populus x berolinensis TaxID=444605 RepID=A0AAD6LXS4_9ROSI|nr:hypothetical protein NC653_031197 [Populus alba x Populus x berolinensis]